MSDLKIDFHVHAFPDWSESLAGLPIARALVREGRQRLQKGLEPLATGLHRIQPLIRFLPKPVIRILEEATAPAAMLHLVAEATVEDLLAKMDEQGVSKAVLIAAPPLSPNEFVLDAARAHPDRILAAVNIPPKTRRPGATLRRFLDRGAKFLKIHPAMDGEGVDSAHYHALLKVADERGIPVILHSGCIHTHIIYKNPELGSLERFESWFRLYPKLRFVIAHMNYHHPEVAIDLAEQYPGLWLDTSWQPAETIAEAVRRIGAERILMASDWPLVGNNLQVAVERVAEAVRSGWITAEQGKMISGENAARFLS